MSITPSTDDLNIIAVLDDEPNDVGGLTPAQAKAKFDEGAATIQTYINDTHIPELDAVHLPYQYGVEGTIQDAMEDLTVGVMPDNTVTAAKLTSDSVTTAKIVDGNVTLAKLGSDVLASEAQAQAGTASDVLMTPLRTKQAIQVSGATTYAGAVNVASGENTYNITIPFTPSAVLVSALITPSQYWVHSILLRSGNSNLLYSGGDPHGSLTASLSGAVLTFANTAYGPAVSCNYLAFR